MVECIKRLYHEIQFCVNWGYKEVTESVKQETGVRHGCSRNPHPFNIHIHKYAYTYIYMDGILDNINQEHAPAPAVGKQIVLALLFADDLATGNLT